jgi:hypothetical protein
VIVSLIRRTRLQLLRSRGGVGRHVQSLRSRLSIMRHDSASVAAPPGVRRVGKGQLGQYFSWIEAT